MVMSGLAQTPAGPRERRASTIRPAATRKPAGQRPGRAWGPTCGASQFEDCGPCGYDDSA